MLWAQGWKPCIEERSPGPQALFSALCHLLGGGWPANAAGSFTFVSPEDRQSLKDGNGCAPLGEDEGAQLSGALA